MNLAPYRPLVDDVSPTRSIGTQTDPVNILPSNYEYHVQWTSPTYATYPTTTTPVYHQMTAPSLMTSTSITLGPPATPNYITRNSPPHTLCLTPASPMTFMAFPSSVPIPLTNAPPPVSSTDQHGIAYTSLTQYLTSHPPTDLVSATIERVATCWNILPIFRPTSARKPQHKKHVKHDRTPGLNISFGSVMGSKEDLPSDTPMDGEDDTKKKKEPPDKTEGGNSNIMPIRVQKGNYTRSKNELFKLKPLIENLKDVPIADYQEEFIASTRVTLQHYRDRLKVFDDRRQVLQSVIPPTEDLDTLLPLEDDELYNDLSLYLVKIESRISEFESKRKKETEEQEARRRKETEELEARQKREDVEYNRERERLREERENEKEIREITERREKEEREHRVKIQELELRKLEIERVRNNNASSENVSSSNLPKIQLVKFDGTVEKYQEFWDNFQTLVDARTDLADNVKLHYLKGQLVGKAASLVEGLRITDENYKVAKDILKDEYGSSQVIQNKIYYEILKLKLYSDKPCHIEDFYRKLEISLKLLENQGVDVNSNEFLAQNLFMKLPGSTQKTLVREKGSVITVKDIREQMSGELRCDRLLKSLNPELCKTKYENNSKPVMSVPNPPVRPRYTTEALVSIERSRPATVCVYCDGSHYSDECDRYRTVDARKEKLGNRCFICLLPGHLSGYCRLEYRCWHCSKFNVHHRSLCPKKYSSSKNLTQHRANVLSSDSRNSFISKPGPSSKSDVRPDGLCNESENTMVSAAYCSVNSVVFLQTAVVNVYDKKNDRFVSVRAILDTASSHSYMSNRLLKQMDFNVGKSRSMNVYTFGTLEPKKMNAPEVSIKIVANEMSYDLKLFVVPSIVSGGNVRAYDTEFLRRVDESYKLADRFLLDKPTQEFDLLIGMDYYSHFIIGEKIQLERNLFLWRTAFGYVLSGMKCNEMVNHEDTVSCCALFSRSEVSIDYVEDTQKIRHQRVNVPKVCENPLGDQSEKKIFEKVLSDENENLDTKSCFVQSLFNLLVRVLLIMMKIDYRSMHFVKNPLFSVIAENFYLWFDKRCVIHCSNGKKGLSVTMNYGVHVTQSSPSHLELGHVPTEQNPADLACRVLCGLDLKCKELWCEEPGSLSIDPWPNFDQHQYQSESEENNNQI
ncbi:hypothetical protein WDU94_008938 [Cyamophila willieti]